jgi:predicted Zn-dependent protease/predicted amino acid-binding ACT domain protein
MDIWAWVFRAREDLQSSGNERLAELMREIPTAVIENRNDEVDALVPEALGLARSLNLDWVEIFLRHWHLQARGGGYEVVPEAVDLLEFSHRDEHRDCPQSVCTVQDLARAYQGADGPGYVQERLDVANETLARIDPTWPCFQCISIERATALIDIGRHQDAVTTVEDMRRRQTAAGSGPTAESCVDAEGLLRLGRAEEALQRLDEGERRDPDRETTFSRFRRLRRTRVLAALGRTDEAAKALLPFDVVLADPAFGWYWADGVAALVDQGARENDWLLGAELEQVLTGQVERGRAWDGVRIAAIHGRLALARDARSTAAHALETGRALASRLRDPARGEAELEALEAALAEAPDDAVHELPDSPEALLEEVPEGEQPDAERAAERLAAGTRRWPDSHELALAHAGALDAMGRAGGAHRVLADFAERHPEDPDAWTAAGLAAILADPERFRGRKIGTTLCGGNIDTHLLANVLVRDLVRSGRISRLRIAAQDRPGALAAITAKFEAAGVNIIEINHSRIFTRLPAKDTVIEVESEARDPKAMEDVIERLESAGFHVERASLD